MSSILCETRIKRKRKKKYEAELQMNFRNGFLIAWKNQDELNGNRPEESDVDLWEGDPRAKNVGDRVDWEHQSDPANLDPLLSVAIMIVNVETVIVMVMAIISSTCRIMFFCLKPGSPSYQMEASSCCTLGWATNCHLGCYQDVSWGDYVADNDLFLSVFNC